MKCVKGPPGPAKSQARLQAAPATLPTIITPSSWPPSALHWLIASPTPTYSETQPSFQSFPVVL